VQKCKTFVTTMKLYNDAPPNSLKDPNENGENRS